jgi:trans-aconitate methyltransferase
LSVPQPDAFEHRTFNAPAERTARMAAIVADAMPKSARTILDLGCGSGRLARAVASAHPASSVLGIDVSGGSIAAAVHDAALEGSTARFQQADYMTFEGGPFDVIVTDGVLHLIPGDTRALFAKLSRDLRGGGMLVCCMPYDCAYNRTFAVTRRVMRACRGPWLDSLILAVARVLHGREMTTDALRERVPYMYIPPVRTMTAELRDRLAPSFGLRSVGTRPMPSISLSQLKHNVTIFQKDATPA